MKTSAQGLKLLVEREGCVLKPYLDSVGVWTDGGHTKCIAAIMVRCKTLLTPLFPTLKSTPALQGVWRKRSQKARLMTVGSGRPRRGVTADMVQSMRVEARRCGRTALRGLFAMGQSPRIELSATSAIIRRAAIPTIYCSATSGKTPKICEAGGVGLHRRSMPVRAITSPKSPILQSPVLRRTLDLTPKSPLILAYLTKPSTASAKESIDGN